MERQHEGNKVVKAWVVLNRDVVLKIRQGRDNLNGHFDWNLVCLFYLSDCMLDIV